MKIFKKIHQENGTRKIYFLGMQIFHYRPHKKEKQVCLGLNGTPFWGCDIIDLKDYQNRQIQFPHPTGIIVAPLATIGDNSIIYQNVTIGAKSYQDGDMVTKENYPRIGKNCIIYSGAVVCGNVDVGNNVIIGANSVVVSDVPDNVVVAGNPAKIVRHRKIKNIPVVFLCNEAYAKYTAVTLYNLFKYQDRDTLYDFIILSNDLTSKSKSLIMRARRHNSVRFIDLDASEYHKYGKIAHIDYTSCYKFNIPYLLPEYDKVLYLDPDLIIHDDLAPLYQTDLGNNYLGVVKYTWKGEKEDIKKFQKSRPLPYIFNAGVMLMNIKKIREDFTLEDLKKTKEYLEKDKVPSQDQYTFNYICMDHVKLLDPKFNCVNCVYDGTLSIEEINAFYKTDYNSLEDLKKDVVIFHTTGTVKAWHKQSPFFDEWLRYVKECFFDPTAKNA